MRVTSTGYSDKQRTRFGGGGGGQEAENKLMRKY